MESELNHKLTPDTESAEETFTVDEIISEVLKEEQASLAGEKHADEVADEIRSAIDRETRETDAGANEGVDAMISSVVNGNAPESAADLTGEEPKGQPEAADDEKDTTRLFRAADAAAFAGTGAAAGAVKENVPLPDETEADGEETIAMKKSKAKTKKKSKVGLIVAASVAGVIIAAALVFLWVPAVRYVAGDLFCKAGKHEIAKTLFVSCDPYKDSAERIAACQEDIDLAAYNDALAIYDEGRYEDAKEAFLALGDYRDSAEWAVTCDGGEELATKNKRYREAVELFDAGSYEEAAAIFRELDGHRDSAERLLYCESVGKTLTVELCKAGEPVYTMTVTPDVLKVGYDAAAYAITVDESSILAVSETAGAKVHSVVVQPTWTWEKPERTVPVETAAAEGDETAEPEMTYAEAYVEVTNGTCGIDADPEQLKSVIVDAVKAGNFETLQFECTLTEFDPIDLEEISTAVQAEPVSAEYDPETHGPTQDESGWELDAEDAEKVLAELKEGETVQLAVTEVPAEVTTAYLNSLYYSAVIGEYSTSGLGNSNRTNNITLACKAIDGYILGPGDKFSYNDVVGERTKAKGYKEAGAYSGGKSVQELGGGICQVSTTLYNAVLLANLKINSRSCHVYPSSYCPLGLDATVSWGGPEFIFTNNTDYPIRISAVVENDRIKIKLYGTDDHMTVEMSYKVLEVYDYETTKTHDEDKANDTGHTGYKVVSYRTVYDENGNMVSSNVEDYSYYSKQDIVVYVKDHEWDDGVVTKEPTCTTAGEKTVTCEICEKTEKQEIPATGHSYSNGVCTVCGAADPNYVSPVTPVEPGDNGPTDNSDTEGTE